MFQTGDLDDLPDDEAADRLRTCLHSDAWVASMLAARPFGTFTRLADHAMTAARALDAAALEQALSAHPRIGERPAGPGVSAAFSRAEQAGVGDDADTAAALRRANEEYEARFGHVFLIRAAGRDASAILAACRERLGHDDATEGTVVREQLGEIAVLRLQALLQVP
jgi:2-oxo-4-hydroxy-4-carboxy-5-ureidoimidazoline decarboxylase